ncbi:S-methyl-5-thioribose-1-phosphate isomerase [Candidatus Bathyarchaeota archaeon A05DMB-2]|jgi:methylthioribose-1-phosphate isomerase|nr:S-methyl-5-thioribose-1-phosphate isomerase [Candidatus Bathyarchaeota archaeon A05DMB-2]
MRTIEWRNGTVITIDQTKLPLETVTLKITTVDQMAEAIKNLRVRGAPLLGAAAAFGLALVAYHSKADCTSELLAELEDAAQTIKSTRPTAVNLFWAVDRVLAKAQGFSGSVEALKTLVIQEAQKIAAEDAEANLAIGKNGAELISDCDTILTHCNAGELATVEYGTALSVIRTAWKQGKKIRVIATETRPLLQGARLTTYELKRDGIPVTLITDNMVGYVMHKRLVNKVIVGADRIVQDAVVNKIGTFTVAVLAYEHGVPFYVAAPKSTFDLVHTSRDVIIEERNPTEVTHFGAHSVAAPGVDVLNPAFDITPLKYVSGIIHEDGVYYKNDFAKFKSNPSPHKST